MGKLFFGDNLDMLREHVKDESVDLVYLDPPFNSKAQYNVLFKSPAGVAANAQLEAFQDSWHWGESAESAFVDVVHKGGPAARILSAFRGVLGESDMMAYLAMMTVRLVELQRVLTAQGSLYLHCDPTASHYLKLILDAAFGPTNFRNEVIWKRSHGHNSAKRYGPSHDVILFYGKSERLIWNGGHHAYDTDYVEKHYRHKDPSGRHYKHENPTGAGVRNGATGQPWRGIDPTAKGRHWARPPAEMDKLDAAGLIHWPEKVGAWPYLKSYLDQMPGVPLQDVWSDIDMLNMMAKERLGYPTQKPLALMERLISASSNLDGLVLDPFCGCGTTVHAAQRLGRDWVGIDVTHHAITIIEERLAKQFPALKVSVEGRPRDLEGARDLARRDKYQFQWWANWLFGVDQYRERKKGADRGIDGERFFLTGPGGGVGRIIISVKGGEHVGVEAVRDLRAVLEREKAELGVLVTLVPHTKPMITEAASLGFYDTQGGRFPRLQLVAVGDLFAGRRPLLPVRAPFEQLRAAVPKAKKRDERQLAFTFALDGGKAETPSGDVVVLDPRRRSTAA